MKLNRECTVNRMVPNSQYVPHPNMHQWLLSSTREGSWSCFSPVQSLLNLSIARYQGHRRNGMALNRYEENLRAVSWQLQKSRQKKALQLTSFYLFFGSLQMTNPWSKTSPRLWEGNAKNSHMISGLDYHNPKSKVSIIWCLYNKQI